MSASRSTLLIIGGGIAAYKCLELIRRLKDRGIAARCILTKAGEQFVTPLAVSALAGERCFTDLFSLTDEADIGHIQLSRSTDLVVVAPATADLIAKMATGQAGDLATARAFNDRIYPLAKAIYGTAPGGHANARLKTCLKLLGHIPSDAMRPPMGPLPDGEVAMLAQALKAAGLQTTEESVA